MQREEAQSSIPFESYLGTSLTQLWPFDDQSIGMFERHILHVTWVGSRDVISSCHLGGILCSIKAAYVCGCAANWE